MTSNELPGDFASLGANKWTRASCSQTFRAPPGYPGQNPGISRQKVCFPLVSRDIPNLLASTPSRRRPPPHRKISGPKSLGLCSCFLPECCEALCTSSAFIVQNFEFAKDPRTVLISFLSSLVEQACLPNNNNNSSIIITIIIMISYMRYGRTPQLVCNF